ncbi:transposase [uncultured Actinomyces sp.]|uniref:transposase n=1 Tax=uncultured Actinomyces sp. TaxID=249061 RepID=UPI001C10F78F
MEQAPEAGARIGASRYEYTARRNGTHPKTVATPAGQLDLAVFKLRQGSFFPSLVDRFGFCGGCVVTPRPQVADDLGQGAPPNAPEISCWKSVICPNDSGASRPSTPSP